MQQESSQRYFTVVVLLESGGTRTIDVTGSTREVAERRALKRTIGGVGIQKEEDKKNA